MRELAPELFADRQDAALGAARAARHPGGRRDRLPRSVSNERARLKAAGFPAPKTLESFDIKASSLPRATFEFLASLEWLDRNDNLCLAGPAGVGKSHLAQALGRAAITAGKKVRFFGADQLIEALYRGLADNTVGKLIERLLRNDFVVIDDLGFTAPDRVAADHLFRFIAAAYEQRSVAITTNVEFERGPNSSPMPRPPPRSSTASYITATSSLLMARASGYAKPAK